MKKEDLVRKFDKQVQMYEHNKNNAAMNAWRKKLLQSANGKVLEVAVGVGSNFPMYPDHVTEITAVDFSPEMLKQAQKSAMDAGLHATMILEDVEKVEFPDQSFDTVVSTCSLCGYSDPVQVLKKLNRWCRDDGQILLLEHGISSNPIYATLQKTFSPLAYRMSGCHYDRDIMAIVKEAGISVIKTEHYWHDIIHLIWAKPNRTSSRQHPTNEI